MSWTRLCRKDLVAFFFPAMPLVFTKTIDPNVFTELNSSLHGKAYAALQSLEACIYELKSVRALEDFILSLHGDDAIRAFKQLKPLISQVCSALRGRAGWVAPRCVLVRHSTRGLIVVDREKIRSRSFLQGGPLLVEADRTAIACHFDRLARQEERGRAELFIQHAFAIARFDRQTRLVLHALLKVGEKYGLPMVSVQNIAANLDARIGMCCSSESSDWAIEFPGKLLRNEFGLSHFKLNGGPLGISEETWDDEECIHGMEFYTEEIVGGRHRDLAERLSCLLLRAWRQRPARPSCPILNNAFVGHPMSTETLLIGADQLEVFLNPCNHCFGACRQLDNNYYGCLSCGGFTRANVPLLEYTIRKYDSFFASFELEGFGGHRGVRVGVDPLDKANFWKPDDEKLYGWCAPAMSFLVRSLPDNTFAIRAIPTKWACFAPFSTTKWWDYGRTELYWINRLTACLGNTIAPKDQQLVCDLSVEWTFKEYDDRDPPGLLRRRFKCTLKNIKVSGEKAKRKFHPSIIRHVQEDEDQ